MAGSGTVTLAAQPVVAPAFIFAGQVTVGELHSITSIACEAETGLPQPLFTVYIILVDPALTPVTKPVLAFTVAIDVLPLLQVPPGSPLLL
jgi:hypothetical protein